MGWVVVVDDSVTIVNEIGEELTQIDPKLTTVHFRNSTDFLAWIEKLQSNDPEMSPAIPTDKFLGLVTSVETWKFKDVQLIGKFKALFVQRKLAEKEDDIFVIFIGYETPTFQKKRFEYKSVNNFLFKPLDKLLLKQMLDIALKGRQPVKTHYTHVQKIARQIEMLKEIELSQIGELSFQTKTEQKLEVGMVAKYYAEFLETKQHRSAMAQVIQYDAVEGQTVAHAKLRFFALDQTQSFNIQKLAQEYKTRRALDGAKAPIETYEFVFVKNDSSPLADEVMPAVERFYDHPIRSLGSLKELDKWLTERATPEAVKKLFVFLDHQNIAGNEAAELDGILKIHAERNLALFVLSPRIFSEELEMKLSSRCEDIFYAPFNRSYIVKGLKLRWTDLANKEELFESVRDVEQTIHVSTPVQLVEVSEAGLVLSYRKEIPIGSFREFVLWMPHEIEVPTLLAQCNFTEKAADGKSFNCHFIFFGLRDHELKFIRRWMLLQYVGEKQKSEST